jgi:hypothetical protein
LLSFGIERLAAGLSFAAAIMKNRSRFKHLRGAVEKVIHPKR